MHLIAHKDEPFCISEGLSDNDNPKCFAPAQGDFAPS